MSLLDDVSIVVTPNGYKAGELYAVVPVPSEGAEEVTSFTNGTTYPFTTFATSGNNITSAIISSAFAGAASNGISVTSGEIYKVTFDYTKNSGDDLRVLFAVSANGAASAISNNVIISASGTYTEYFTITSTTTSYLQMGTGNSGHSLNASITNVSVKEYTSADMDVTRATAATRVDEDGLVNYAEVVTGSDIVTNGDFSNGSTDWTLQNGWALGSNDVVFNGSLSSYRKLFQVNFLTIGKVYKLSFEIKSISAGSIANFEPNSPSFDTVGVKTQTYVATFDDLYLEPTNDAVLTIDNISIKEVTRDNVPRIDYTGGGCPHILAEPQRTNLVTYSEDFTQWSKEATVTLTPNYSTSPDGTNNATRVQLDADDSIYLSSLGSSKVFSIYVKGVAGETIRISNGVATMFTLTGNWDRLEVFDTSGSSTLISINTYSSATARDIQIWGAQLEESYATSYIPTSGSTVTRNQDIFTRDGIGSLINDSEGVLFVEMSALSDDGTDRRITITDGTVNNAINIGLSRFSGNINAEIHSGGSLQTSGWGATGITQINNNKFALSWGSGTMKFYVNGSSTSSQTGITSPIGLNNLKFSAGDDTLNLFAKVKQLQVYTTALTDEQLLQLTGESGTDFYESYAEMAAALTYTIQ